MTITETILPILLGIYLGTSVNAKANRKNATKIRALPNAALPMTTNWPSGGRFSVKPNLFTKRSGAYCMNGNTAE